jgi:conjugal transfer pilus assembly protein TraV
MKRGVGSSAFAACVLLGGCSTSWITGLDATSHFACKSPDGVSCVSTSKVFNVVNTTPGGMNQWDPTSPEAKERVETLKKNPAGQPAAAPTSTETTPPAPATVPSGSGMRTASAVQHTAPAPLPTASAAAPGGLPKTSPALMDAPTVGTPLRSPERILRVWVAPFEDADGDLHDQRYLYLTVYRGQWSIEAARKQIREQYKAIRLLSASTGASDTDERSAEPASAASVRAALPNGLPTAPAAPR